jgi:predicted DNA-binding transcriptional regulator YafY
VRADRLVAVLLLLQRRGRVTAAEVAAELEVSERTARRDLEALGVAGLPIYSQQGRGGGWQLLGGATTDLSGLNADEVRALFMVAGPASATPEVAAALRKLVRALPEPFQTGAEVASSAVVVDPHGWSGARGWSAGTPWSGQPLTHLDTVQRAVIESAVVRLTYLDRRRQPSARRVRPLGLASKQGRWYLVADTDTDAGRRTFRVDRMIEAAPTGETFERPDDFDIRAEWQSVTDELEQVRLPVEAVLVAAPDVIDRVRFLFGPRLRIGPTRPDGRVELAARGYNVHMLAVELAGLGDEVEVLDPPELRQELARIGAELVDQYRG